MIIRNLQKNFEHEKLAAIKSVKKIKNIFSDNMNLVVKRAIKEIK